MCKRGAVMVWTDGDSQALPADFAAVAPGAEIGAPFDCTAATARCASAGPFCGRN
jgi:hypothetical protein